MYLHFYKTSLFSHFVLLILHSIMKIPHPLFQNEIFCWPKKCNYKRSKINIPFTFNLLNHGKAPSKMICTSAQNQMFIGYFLFCCLKICSPRLAYLLCMWSMHPYFPLFSCLLISYQSTQHIQVRF